MVYIRLGQSDDEDDAVDWRNHIKFDFIYNFFDSFNKIKFIDFIFVSYVKIWGLFVVVAVVQVRKTVGILSKVKISEREILFKTKKVYEDSFCSNCLCLENSILRCKKLHKLCRLKMKYFNFSDAQFCFGIHVQLKVIREFTLIN